MTIGEREGGSDDDGRLLALFDLLGRRWALRVLWELRWSPLTYRELADRVPGLSTSVMTHRLRELRGANLIDHVGRGYELTSPGRELVTHLEGLREWADRTDVGPPRAKGRS